MWFLQIFKISDILPLSWNSIPWANIYYPFMGFRRYLSIFCCFLWRSWKHLRKYRVFAADISKYQYNNGEATGNINEWFNIAANWMIRRIPQKSHFRLEYSRNPDFWQKQKFHRISQSSMLFLVFIRSTNCCGVYLSFCEVLRVVFDTFPILQFLLLIQYFMLCLHLLRPKNVLQSTLENCYENTRKTCNICKKNKLMWYSREIKYNQFCKACGNFRKTVENFGESHARGLFLLPFYANLSELGRT